MDDQATGHDLWAEIERLDSEAMLRAWCGWGEPAPAPVGSSRIGVLRRASAPRGRLRSFAAEMFARRR